MNFLSTDYRTLIIRLQDSYQGIVRLVSGALKNGVINEEEFNMLQTLHLETLNELTGVDRRMEAEHRFLVEKSLLEEIKKNTGTKA